VAQGVVALQGAGGKDSIPTRPSKLDLLAAAREWATTEERREALRSAIGKYLDRP
jgi:hypothetical protein